MKINISPDKERLGKAAGAYAAQLIRDAIAENGKANVILATGTSQFETLNQLISEKGIEWGKVTMFHLDEYIGMSLTHPASFRKYLTERFLEKVPRLIEVYLINGEKNVDQELIILNERIKANPIDVALVGIGGKRTFGVQRPTGRFRYR